MENYLGNNPSRADNHLKGTSWAYR